MSKARLAVLLVVVMLVASFAGVAQAEPPAPKPVYQFTGICYAWDGQTYSLYFGGASFWVWFYDAFLPVCPLGDEMGFDLSDAVVGQFIANTQLLQGPDSTLGVTIKGKPVVMEIGKTAWVHGTDVTGSYFLINVGASTAWVPVSSMGPNYDDVWNGAPLVVPVID